MRTLCTSKKHIENETRQGTIGLILRTFGAVVQFGCTVYVIENYIVELTSCVGPSMLPTLNKVGDLVLAEHISFRFLREPRVGDVVLSKSPKNPSQIVCKRIVGMPNDLVKTTRGKNGPPVEVVVPRGHIWLEGDNARNSTDSRYYGPVPQALLCGRVFWKIWPPREFGELGDAPPRPDLGHVRKRVRFNQDVPRDVGKYLGRLNARREASEKSIENETDEKNTKEHRVGASK